MVKIFWFSYVFVVKILLIPSVTSSSFHGEQQQQEEISRKNEEERRIPSSSMMERKGRNIMVTGNIGGGSTLDVQVEDDNVLPLPPNIFDATYSYNALLGMPPSEQRLALVGMPMFVLSGSRGSSPGNAASSLPYNQPEQVQDMFVGERCEYTGISNSVFWSTSSTSLRRQAESSSRGLESEIDLEASLGGFVTASTSVRNALLFGNSRTTTVATVQRDSGYTFSFDAQTRRIIYGVEIDYDNVLDNTVSSWTDEFRFECANLGSTPTLQKALTFFKRVGTHGLATANFGQQCLVSAFMESGQTFHSYQQFREDASSVDFGLLWWQSSSNELEQSSTTGQSTEGFSYIFDNKRCEGSIAHGSPCGGNMPASDVTEPTIVQWTYKPIWDMSIPGLKDGAKVILRETFQSIVEAAQACSETRCNGHGACSTSLEGWSRVVDGSSTPVTDVSQLFDSATCFCDDGYIGPTCNEGRPVAMEAPSQISSNFLNTYDGEVHIQNANNDPLAGMFSVHDNFHEDRRFKARTRAVVEDEFSPQTGTQITLTSRHNEPFKIVCDKDKVLTRLSSTHNNEYEDRRWTGQCTHFNNTHIDEETCTGFSVNNPSQGGYVNEYDQPVDFTCPGGTVLVGVYAIHSRDHQDRKWSFRCCGLKVEHEALVSGDDSGTSFYLRMSDWTDDLNDWNGPLEVNPQITDDGGNPVPAGICGFGSYHIDQREDRKFRFRYCLPDKLPTRSAQATLQVTATPLDAVSVIDCPVGSVVSYIYSAHDNFSEDRTWTYQCHTFNGNGWSSSLDDCQWTDYVNGYDDAFYFSCGDKHVIAGIYSYHDNFHEDRTFKFKCCRWKNAV